ncbi:MAG: PIN domain-containing protein [Acidimicrobiales bacterium]
MNDARRAGVVVDTMVISWLLEDRQLPRADRYRALIGTEPVLLAFQTVMELRFGALQAGWGELRRRRLEWRLAGFTVVQPDDEMITVCAKLRSDCRRVGHALGDKLHDGDRWIAAAAVRLGCPLVSHDGLFRETPGLQLIAAEGA